jgi:hypothetical protein
MRFLIFIALVALFNGCRDASKPVEPTYKTFAEIEPSAGSPLLLKLFQKYKQLKPPTYQPTVSWPTGWMFQLGSNAEALQADPRQVNSQPIDLPHRVDKADCSIWYRKEVRIPADGFLRIEADDGAQLFVNGERVARIDGNYFPVRGGTQELIIRVLNNAMSGGLLNVSFLSTLEYQNYSSKLTDFYILKHSIQKVLLLNNPNEVVLKQAMLAIENPIEEHLESLRTLTDDYPYITGPWIQRKNKGVFVIKVWLERSATIQLHYGFSDDRLDNYLEKTCDLCEFELTQIPVDGQLYYQLKVDKTISPRYHFSTKETDSFTFNVWADSQSGWESFRQNIANTQNFDDAFGIGIGDLVGNGSIESEWRMFFNILSTSSAQRPYYLLAGNHEYDGYYDDLIPENYNRLIGGPSYKSWTYSNCAFISLDPNECFPIGIPEDSQQYKWFREQLESDQWKSATWRFILIHQPPYSQGWPGYEGDGVVRDLLSPVIESAEIDFVISGHTHDYERLTKIYGNHLITFLIVGGAGGSLEPVESSTNPEMDTVVKQHHMGRFFIQGNKIRFEVRSLENELLDGFERKK